MADEGGALDYAKEFSITRPVFVESLTWVNKGASACYIQIFDLPWNPSTAKNITDTNSVTGELTSAGHLLETGDAITVTGVAGISSGFVRVATVDTFYVYDTLAHAQARSSATGLVLPTNDADPGTYVVTGVIPEEYPVLAETNAPANVGSFTIGNFRRGCTARAVTAVNGSTAISASDIKFTPRYRRSTRNAT